MSSVITDLVGNELVDSAGQTIAVPQLPAGGALGLYFSAHWCPPCKMFTPELAEFYRNFKKTELGDRLEIVFVSSDRDESEFKSYHAEMPWPALPYIDRSTKEKLSKKFKVSGIPTLVLVDPETGKMITDSGREQVSKHPNGEGFPWRPLPLLQLVSEGRLLKGTEGEEVDAKEALYGKVVGFYFSAHWCPPCRSFTPQLVGTYNKLKAAGRNFEIVFVSSDRDDASMKEYFSEMPWLAIPYDDPRQDQLSSHFSVSGIPALVLLDEARDVITTEGRAAVGKDAEGEKFPWIPPPFGQLSDDTAPALNRSTCVVLLTENKDDLVKQAEELLSVVATDYREKYKASENDANPIPDIRFMYEGPESSGIIGSLKEFLSSANSQDDADAESTATNPKPRIWVIDISEERYYEVSWSSDGSDPLGKGGLDKLRQLVDDAQSEKLAYKPLRG